VIQPARSVRDQIDILTAPILLASGSPRRRELLETLGLHFEVHPSDIEERPEPDEGPADFAARAARDKAVDVASRHPDRCVLGADTVVEIDGVILGKPAGVDGAREMLRSLSDRDHLVHTGVALVIGGHVRHIVDSARVRFFSLTDNVIAWYVDSGEPMDKAGAYAIQGKGGLLVAEMRGSPQTVIGLPIHRLPELFAMQGLDFWKQLRPRS
jgi:septum formation protein